MQYQELGDTGLKTSIIGLGCEYVWHSSEKQVVDLVEASIDAGINYIDIFVGTPSTRNNFGKAIEGKRDKVMLAGHLGCADDDGQYMTSRDPKIYEDFIQQFYSRLQIDYIDILFLHNCDEEEDYRTIFEEGMYERALELKQNGKAGFIGFSSHNTKIALKAVKSGKIDILMFPVNPLFNLLPRDSAHDKIFDPEAQEDLSEEEKEKYPSQQELYNACVEREIPIIAMKPFAGGNVLKDFEDGSPALEGLINLTPVQAINYVLSQPGVVMALPGFKNVKELNASLEYLTASKEEKDYGKLTESDVYKFKGRCMYCNHCQPCPQDIDIASVIKYKDRAVQGGITEEIIEKYEALSLNASDCTYCQLCTKRCPFGIDVNENMKKAVEIFH